MKKKRAEMRVITDLNDNSRLEIPSVYKNKEKKFKEGSPTNLNIIRVMILAVCGFFAPVLQEAFFNDLRIFGVKPNLAMVFVFLFAVVMNERAAIFMGAAEGIYVDVVFGRALGVYGLLFTLLAYASSSLLKNRFKEVPVLSLAAAPGFFTVYTFAESFLSRIVHLLSRTGTAETLYGNFLKHIVVRILPVSLYDLIIFAVCFVPLRYLWKIAARRKNKELRFSKRMDEDEQRI